MSLFTQDAVSIRLTLFQGLKLGFGFYLGILLGQGLVQLAIKLALNFVSPTSSMPPL